VNAEAVRMPKLSNKRKRDEDDPAEELRQVSKPPVA